MSRVEDITFTVLEAEKTYTNAMTPVSAGPWPNKYELDKQFPVTPVDYDPNNLIWDFGDGTTYTGISASHIYNWPGTYTIKLTLIDSAGEVVKSMNDHVIRVYDFIPTQFEYVNDSPVYDIPVCQKTVPITVNFMLSWQHYNQGNREAPQCPTGTQHMMNVGKQPGYWHCGDSHGSEVQPPIYTFNVYASGSDSRPIIPERYLSKKFSHLDTGWSFFSTTSELSTIPTTHIDVTQLDTLTGSSGEPNTYEPIYFAYNVGTNSFEQVSPDTNGSVLVGLSGNASFYYYDTSPKCRTSRNDPIIIYTQLDSMKLYDRDTVYKKNLSSKSFNNIKKIKRANIKPRVNHPTKLNITSIGLNEFAVNENKWQNNEIVFTVTPQDDLNFNIVDDHVYTDLTVTLKDLNNPDNIQPTDYYINETDLTSTSMTNFYQGTLFSLVTSTSAQLEASATFTQVSGYTTDAIHGWMNIYTPPSPGVTEYGQVYKYGFTQNIDFDTEKVDNNITSNIVGEGEYINPNGIISSATLVTSGSNLTGPPAIQITDLTGTGAEIIFTFDQLEMKVTDVTVTESGYNYSQTPDITYIANVGATLPLIDVTVDNNYHVNMFAVGLYDDTKNNITWSMETGPTPRLLKITYTGEVVASKPLTDIDPDSSVPIGMSLNSEHKLCVCTTAKIFTVSDDMSVIESFVPTKQPTAIEYLPDDNLAVLYNDRVEIRQGTDLTAISETQSLSIGTTPMDMLVTHDHIYIITDDDNISKMDMDLNPVGSVLLPTPVINWTSLTPGLHDDLYVSDGQNLYKIDTTEMEFTHVNDLSSGANVTSICGDTRGYIWCIDNGNKEIVFIDTESPEMTRTVLPNRLIYNENAHTDFPEYNTIGTAVGQISTSGDWTGFHWLKKYGYITSKTITLTGASNTFSIHPATGSYHIRKFNESHNASETIQSYAMQPWLKDNSTLWDFLGTSIGTKASSVDSLGKKTYEKIANFVSNNNDIDDCCIDSLHNYALTYKHNIQQYNLSYPPSFLRLMDLCSVKHKRLYGEFDKLTETFDMYTNYTRPLTRENLGYQLDFYEHLITPGEDIVAYEKFSKTFKRITTSTATSGTFDENGNKIGISIDTDLSPTSVTQYPLSSYSPFWGWGLVAPDTVTGVDITNYYDFWTYNPKYTEPQQEGVINWSDDSTTLSQTQTSYIEWSRDMGVMDNILEHQLRTGLGLFQSEANVESSTNILITTDTPSEVKKYD